MTCASATDTLPGIDDIRALLRQLGHDEDVVEAARRHMDDYRGFALARPQQPHVELLQAVLKTKLTGLLAAARREGLLP